MTTQKTIVIALTAHVKGHDYSLDVELYGEPTATVRGLLDRGLQKVLTDASSTCIKVKNAEGLDVDATDEDKAKAVTDRLAKITKGEYSFGGGGGRSLSNEDHALKAVLIKYGVKWSKGLVVATALHDYAVAYAKHLEQDYEETLIDDVRELMEADALYAAVIAERQAKKKPTESTLPTL